MADWDALTSLVGALEADSAFVEDCWTRAVAMVDKLVGDDTALVPDEILQGCYVDVGADLFWRRAARNGIVGINSQDATPVRINRDPMEAVRLTLAPFLTGGFA